MKKLLTSVCVLFNRRGKVLGLGETFEQRSTRRKESLVRKQGNFLLLFLISWSSHVDYRWINNNSAKLGDNAGTLKTTKTTKKIPTGLVADWQNKISKTSQAADNTQNKQRASPPLGGLADDDALGERPDSIQVGNRYNRYNRYKTRKNEVHSVLFWAWWEINIQCKIKMPEIAVYDSDPDFIEYVKPKVRPKVSVF